MTSLSLSSLQRPCLWPCHHHRSGVRAPACLFKEADQPMSPASKYKRTRAGGAAFQGCPFWGRPLHQALLLALLLSGPGLWPGPPAPGQTSLSAGKAGQRSAPCGPSPLPSISTCLPAPPGPGLSHACLALGSADWSLSSAPSPAPLGTPPPLQEGQGLLSVRGLGRPGLRFRPRAPPPSWALPPSPGVPEER